eukprot:TRINITY_DN11416_c4_g5_i1.p2 TRINITY_DN11416_c4_g5~~TRINITY_DN11416_c4_g5_i1.p2  ORF type:complete len:125 (+),score=22.95 TRINITY_DN11416_c4_g5_i1:219-593(+)
MASCPEYAKSVKHMSVTDDSLGYLAILSGRRFPRLEKFTYEHTFSSPQQFFGMLRLAQSAFEIASTTSSLTLSLLFRSAKAPPTSHEDDWQYGQATAIAVDDLVKLLDSKHALNIRLQFYRDDI